MKSTNVGTWSKIAHDWWQVRTSDLQIKCKIVQLARHSSSHTWWSNKCVLAVSYREKLWSASSVYQLLSCVSFISFQSSFINNSFGQVITTVCYSLYQYIDVTFSWRRQFIYFFVKTNNSTLPWTWRFHLTSSHPLLLKIHFNLTWTFTSLPSSYVPHEGK